MATDALITRGGNLAALNDTTAKKLDSFLPHYWSKGNPIDICEDATVERFHKVLETCIKDHDIDGYLVIYTPIGDADPAANLSHSAHGSLSKGVLKFVCDRTGYLK